MTAVRPAPPVSPPTEGRVPRRVPVPGWLDLRLVLGLLLVLGSILVGARVMSTAHATVPVWAATGDLSAGTVLRSDDVTAVDVRLESGSGAYVSSGVHLGGRVLGRPVRKGELLPRSALEQAEGLVQVALPVQAAFVPPSLSRGQLVDVYAVSPSGGAAATGAPGPATLVVAGVAVQELAGRAAGVLSAPTTTVQVVVSVPEHRASQVLGAIGGRSLALVVHPSVEGGADRAGSATVAPAPTTPATPTG